MPRKVCVVTGSRAEYGLLHWVLHDLRAHPDIELQLVATGTHLAPEFGCTVDEIERDGFVVDLRVEMLVSGDTPAAIARSVALGVIGMSDALHRLRPDIVLVLGDRFEMLAVAQACLLQRVVLAHIAGGDTTEGAIDESMRHAITKMSHVHFVTNDESGRRVRQLGENPRHVHVVGSPGLDHVHRRALLSPVELEAALGAPLGRRNLLVTFHPVTLKDDDGYGELEELLAALDGLPADILLWLTLPNADAGGRRMAELTRRWAADRADRARCFTSLGSLCYLSLMREADAVVGNSSSGLYEAPTFGVPTVDIGSRQHGRLAASSVLRCEPQRTAIRLALDQALTLDVSNVTNPYGDGRTAGRIVEQLAALPLDGSLLVKHFHMLETAHG
jgi:UDP-hydrolysing UDP-N-acetyl-D-glucosamine 2-epimerase